MSADKYQITTIDGHDYVSLSDAKKMLGVKTAKELRSHGESTIKIGGGRPLWSVDWLVSVGLNPCKAFAKLDPDLEWIRRYDASWRERDTRPRHALLPSEFAIAPADSRLTSSQRLPQLMEIVPPPRDVRPIDWGQLETAVGIVYPESFKTFADVYGESTWFDRVSPLLPVKNQSLSSFRQSLDEIFARDFQRNTEHPKAGVLEAPHFTQKHGWLPFMWGWDGESYAWVIEEASGDWYIVNTYMGHEATVLPPISMTEIFLGWLLGEPLMQQVWPTFEQFKSHSPEWVEKPFSNQ